MELSHSMPDITLIWFAVVGGKRADQFVGRGFVPRFRRQEAKQPFGDELMSLRRPMPPLAAPG